MPRARVFPSTSQRTIYQWSSGSAPLVVESPAEIVVETLSGWPEDLPGLPLIEGYREQGANIVIRSSMTEGPPRVRRRGVASVRPYTLLFHMTRAQVQILDDFFTDDCAGGARPFIYIDLHTGAPLTYRFTGAPTYTPRGDQQNWTVTLPLEAYQRVP